MHCDSNSRGWKGAAHGISGALVLAVLLCGPGLVLADAETEPSPAVRVVEGLHATMLETLQGAEDLGYEGRYAKLAPAIEAAFDLPFMAEKSVGSHWRKLSEEERADWVDLFERNMVASYASRLDEFRGQQFESLGSEPGAHDTITVRTKIVDPGNPEVPLTYRLRETEAGWRIIDIYLKGTVSELAVRRSDYAAVLRSGGFPALKKSVAEKISEFEAG